MLVAQILKSKGSDGVVTILPSTPVADAVQMLAARKIGALVVSPDGQRLGGILSERDIVREIARRGPAVLQDKVDAIMTARVTHCARGDSTDQVLQAMTDGRFRHLPVVESGVLIGLISIGDVVKARLAELAHEKDALEGMIKGH